MSRSRQCIGSSRLRAGIIAFCVGLVGLVGLLYFTYTFPPTTETLPFLFALLFLTVSGLAIPGTVFLDGRLRRPADPSHIWQPIRQGMWLGLWATLCVWLQWVDLLDWVTALLFLIILILIEWFIISRR
jgi:hypothetical protein